MACRPHALRAAIALAHGHAPWQFPPTFAAVVRPCPGCCRSSVVEHSLGKGEVQSSSLCGSTIRALMTRRVYRVIQRKPLGGAADRRGVLLTGRSAGADRGVATALQHRTAAQESSLGYRRPPAPETLGPPSWPSGSAGLRLPTSLAEGGTALTLTLDHEGRVGQCGSTERGRRHRIRSGRWLSCPALSSPTRASPS